MRFEHSHPLEFVRKSNIVILVVMLCCTLDSFEEVPVCTIYELVNDSLL